MVISCIVFGYCALFMATQLVSGASAGLTLAKKCGYTNCNKYEYCNTDTACDSCEKICDIKSHNYEQGSCETNCQGKSIMQIMFSNCEITRNKNVCMLTKY